MTKKKQGGSGGCCQVASLLSVDGHHNKMEINRRLPT
jgi:hypothetical protein